MKNHTIKTMLALFMALLAPEIGAQSTFSPEQLREIAKLIQAERVDARRELCAELVGLSPNLPATSACAKPSAIVDQPVEPPGDVPRVGDEILRVQTAGDPSKFLGGAGETVLDRALDKGGSRFELTTTTESSRAGIRWSSSVDGTDGPDKKTFSSWSTTLSTPVSKTDPTTTNIATLDGFANASSLAFAFNHFVLTGSRTPTKAQKLAFLKRANLDLTKGIDMDLDEILTELVRTKQAILYEEAEALYFRGDSRRWVFGASATVGHEEFEFRDATTLGQGEVRRVPLSAGVYAGFFPSGSDLFLSAGFDLQRSYKAGKPRTLCPTSEDGVVECFTGSFLPPARLDKHLVSLEARTQLGKAGISLKLTHDLKSSDTGVDLPIYLFRDEKRLLTGGFRVGWTNTDHFIAGLFVGSSFDLGRR